MSLIELGTLPIQTREPLQAVSAHTAVTAAPTLEE